MQALFYILGLLALLWGGLVSMIAKSAIHEIQAYVMFLIAAVLIVGGGIVDQIKDLRRESREAARRLEVEMERTNSPRQ